MGQQLKNRAESSVSPDNDDITYIGKDGGGGAINSFKIKFATIKSWILNFISGAFAPLVGGVIPVQYLPNSVFDVVYGTYVDDEIFEVESEPVELEEGKIYIDISGGANDGKKWRYSIEADSLVSVDAASLMTAAEIKATYESNPNTNAYTDSEKAATATIGDKLNALLAINSQAGNYTLQLSDANKNIEMNNVTAATITIPTNASVAFAVGTTIYIDRQGAGTVTFSSAGGVSIISATGLNIMNVGNMVAVIKKGTNVWKLVGNLI